jgi:hypothetical protein
VKRAALILTLILTLTTAVSAAGAPPDAGYTDPFAWQKCHHKVDFNLKITAARNMRCRAARRVMRRYDGSIARRFDTPDGFHCRRVKGRAVSGIWRCSKKRKAFKFKFGD